MPIDLRNESPGEAANLVRYVIDECLDGGVRLAYVNVSESCWKAWVLDGLEPSHRGVPLRRDPGLRERIEFFRRVS